MAINNKDVNGEKWYTRLVDNVSFFNTINTLIDNLKDWVEGMVSGTLMIHNGNWFNYIKPRPELKTLDPSKNITGPDYGYWVSIDRINNGEATTTKDGTGIWSEINSTKWDDFIEWIKIRENQENYLISIRCCELILPNWVRTIQFTCSNVNFEYLTIYPPKYNRDASDYTNNEKCNGHRISVFQLPADGVYVTSPNIDEDHKNSRRVLLMEKQDWGNRNALSTKGGIFDETAAKKSIKLYPDKMKDESLVVIATENNIPSSDSDAVLGNGTIIGRLKTTTQLNTVGLFMNNITDVENYSAFTHLQSVTDISYYTSVIPSHGGFILKPGVVGDMIWFNNYWYLCGTR